MHSAALASIRGNMARLEESFEGLQLRLADVQYAFFVVEGEHDEYRLCLCI